MGKSAGERRGQDKTPYKGLPRLAVAGFAYAVAIALVFAFVPQDFVGWEMIALAMWTAFFTLFFGPFTLVPGLPCGFLPESSDFWSLLPILPLYIAHIAFVAIISRKTSQWRRFGKYGETMRRCAVAMVATASAAAIWYELPRVENYEVRCDATRLAGRELRFAVVTDLHSCRYGEGQQELVKAVLDAKPDALLLVGDIFDDRLPDDGAQEFISRLVSRMPCIYVTGNHEFWSENMDAKLRWLWKAGVATLDGECLTVDIKGVEVDFCGVDDPTYIYDEGWLEELDRAFSKSNPSRLRILLSHRPEYDWAYCQYDFDLLVSGHLHGGQWRIPRWNIGVFGPEGNRFFPKFANGTYALPNGASLALSRGLARESIPLPRFFNHPELMILHVRPKGIGNRE